MGGGQAPRGPKVGFPQKMENYSDLAHYFSKRAQIYKLKNKLFFIFFRQARGPMPRATKGPFEAKKGLFGEKNGLF